MASIASNIADAVADQISASGLIDGPVERRWNWQRDLHEISDGRLYCMVTPESRESSMRARDRSSENNYTIRITTRAVQPTQGNETFENMIDKWVAVCEDVANYLRTYSPTGVYAEWIEDEQSIYDPEVLDQQLCFASDLLVTYATNVEAAK